MFDDEEFSSASGSIMVIMGLVERREGVVDGVLSSLSTGISVGSRLFSIANYKIIII